jgi:hypothetical protein
MLVKDLKGKQMGIDNYNYDFSNDMTDADMGISAAQHDCKLVFDSIIDDRSFQEADFGLVLYYANQIMYALDKVSEKDDYNKGYQDGQKDILRQLKMWIEEKGII